MRSMSPRPEGSRGDTSGDDGEVGREGSSPLEPAKDSEIVSYQSEQDFGCQIFASHAVNSLGSCDRGMVDHMQQEPRESIDELFPCTGIAA